jgi:hypothetical protein
MTIAEILAWLLAFAATFAALGAATRRRGGDPVRAALGGLLAFMSMAGVIALPVVLVLGFLELREVWS